MDELFDKNVIHPAGSALFYYPENENDSISGYNPTVEEVVETCLNYKGIPLPQSFE